MQIKKRNILRTEYRDSPILEVRKSDKQKAKEAGLVRKEDKQERKMTGSGMQGNKCFKMEGVNNCVICSVTGD